jgi:hypothetical protein
MYGVCEIKLQKIKQALKTPNVIRKNVKREDECANE